MIVENYMKGGCVDMAKPYKIIKIMDRDNNIYPCFVFTNYTAFLYLDTAISSDDYIMNGGDKAFFYVAENDKYYRLEKSKSDNNPNNLFSRVGTRNYKIYSSRMFKQIVEEEVKA